ncbi:hypothetical protein L1987_24095 [Smallanthus sonchifolius]|uniref:Uncharacterized protein n=1 Tax=Smallanthus sonchifolius TaxID=185202 RepID=A0ACB9IIS1_9ASTR|nr:hypothetical protein L1987_24095 [Smallanthus sonchifolius]
MRQRGAYFRSDECSKSTAKNLLIQVLGEWCHGKAQKAFFIFMDNQFIFKYSWETLPNKWVKKWKGSTYCDSNHSGVTWSLAAPLPLMLVAFLPRLHTALAARCNSLLIGWLAPPPQWTDRIISIYGLTGHTLAKYPTKRLPRARSSSSVVGSSSGRVVSFAQRESFWGIGFSPMFALLKMTFSPSGKFHYCWENWT